MNRHAPSVRRPATYEDLLDAPETMVAELIEGALHLHPRPGLGHAVAGSSLTDELVSPFQKGRGGPGGWWIVLEPELHLGPDVLVPDLAGWRRERMPVRPREPWTSLAPDWVCEIPSAGTRRIDLTDKRRLYAQAGIPCLWFIDPEEQTLEAFALRGGAWTLIAALKDADEASVPPFDAILLPALRPLARLTMNRHAPSVRRPATYEDLLDAPETMVAELIEGALHLHPRPGLGHAVAGSSLTGTLNVSFQQGRGGPGGWWILVEPELHLGPDVLVPDLAGWRRERMPVRPREPWTSLAPDWVCEIPSAGTRRIDLTDKRRLYAQAGIPCLWFIDPEEQTLEAFALRGGAWTLIAALKDADEASVPPFDAISFPLSVLWPD